MTDFTAKDFQMAIQEEKNYFDERKTSHTVTKDNEMKEELYHDLNCSICLELNFQPVKLASCSHVFCKHCLEKLRLYTKNNNFPCFLLLLVCICI